MSIQMIIVLTGGLIFGLLYALAAAYLLTAVAIKSSNNLGSGKGTFKTFAVKEMKYYAKKNNIKEKDIK